MTRKSHNRYIFEGKFNCKSWRISGWIDNTENHAEDNVVFKWMGGKRLKRPWQFMYKIADHVHKDRKWRVINIFTYPILNSPKSTPSIILRWITSVYPENCYWINKVVGNSRRIFCIRSIIFSADSPDEEIPLKHPQSLIKSPRNYLMELKIKVNKVGEIMCNKWIHDGCHWDENKTSLLNSLDTINLGLSHFAWNWEKELLYFVNKAIDEDEKWGSE